MADYPIHRSDDALDMVFLVYRKANNSKACTLTASTSARPAANDSTNTGFRQRLQARLHARLWAASVAGIADLPSAKDLASNSANNSNSSLTLALLSRPRAVTRPPLSLPLASALLSASNLF